MPLIDQLAAEYARLHPGRSKPADQFSDEIIALCNLLERRFPALSQSIAENTPA